MIKLLKKWHIIHEWSNYSEGKCKAIYPLNESLKAGSLPLYTKVIQKKNCKNAMLLSLEF